MIQQVRIQRLNTRPERQGRYVLYWMQQSQRSRYNHALEHAADCANGKGLPLVVFFGLTPDFPGANVRHYHFMLEGLENTMRDLEDRGITMVIRICPPDRGALEMARNAAVMVTDRGYLAVQRQWRMAAAREAPCPLVQVESDVVVPVEEASGKEEFSAGTLRPKIHRKLGDFLTPLKERKMKKDSLGLNFEGAITGNAVQSLSLPELDHSVKPVSWLAGGAGRAEELFIGFLDHNLDNFGEQRNDPARDTLSHMSPYLHFGQISPLYLALEVLKRKSPGGEVFLEELIVRRELAMNFVYYNRYYDRYACLPEWARMTLMAHKKDRRPWIYEREVLERAGTHDAYWNAAQRELTVRGKMHGYMRMYWGKKILEWSRLPEEAFDTALYLNNRYSLDGRDPNGFAGVAWCFGKHDRAWGEREVFGKVRYMNDRGLERKFDMQAYLERVNGYMT